MRKHKWILAMSLIAVAIIFTLFIWHQKHSSAKQLAALEAQRAVPNNQNAAFKYMQLFHLEASTIAPKILDDVNDQTRMRRWKTTEYPEIAEWLKNQQDLIDTLSSISQMDACVFPVIEGNSDLYSSVDLMQHQFLLLFTEWGRYLERAAYLDLGEGRIQQAIQKAHTITGLGNHIGQQPHCAGLMAGTILESTSIPMLIDIVITTDLSHSELSTLQQQHNFNATEYRKRYPNALLGEKLISQYHQRTFSPLERLNTWLWLLRHRSNRSNDSVIKRHHRLVAVHLGYKLILGLKQHHGQTGQWPATLDSLEMYLSPEMMTETRQQFVYQRTQDSFVLYWLGPNEKDENGQHEFTTEPGNYPDDWSIYPPMLSDAYNDWQKAVVQSSEE